MILNAAPARELSASLLRGLHVLVPNRGELATLTDEQEPADVEAAGEVAARVEGPGAVVVTLGRALLVEVQRRTHVTGIQVDAVDTTVAGDGFCGGLADALARGENLEDPVRWGVAVGSLTTRRRGAQSSLPTWREVEQAR